MFTQHIYSLGKATPCQEAYVPDMYGRIGRYPYIPMGKIFPDGFHCHSAFPWPYLPDGASNPEYRAMIAWFPVKVNLLERDRHRNVSQERSHP